MMNRVNLIGRMVKDAELRQVGKGATSTATFTLAIDNWTKGPDGNRTTSFINCVAWNQTAEHIAKWGRKGILTAIEGRLVQHSYDAKDGSKRSITEVVVDGFDFLESITKEPAETTIDPNETREEPELSSEEIAKLEAKIAAAKKSK